MALTVMAIGAHPARCRKCASPLIIRQDWIASLATNGTLYYGGASFILCLRSKLPYHAPRARNMVIGKQCSDLVVKLQDGPMRTEWRNNSRNWSGSQVASQSKKLSPASIAQVCYDGDSKGAYKVMQRKIAIIIVAVVIIGAGAYFLMRQNSTTTTTTNTPTSTSSATDTQAVAATITYTDNGFLPQTVTVKSGQTVAIKNEASSDMQFDSDPHPIHTTDPELNIDVVAPGEVKTFTVTKAGTFGYHNHLNPSQTGKIVVQ